MRSGTSFATPIVSGFVALLLAYQKRLGLPPDPHGVKMIIVETAIECPGHGERDCQKFLAGMLNVSGAIAAIARQGRKSSINLSTGSAMNEASELTATASAADAMPSIANSSALESKRAAESLVPSDCGCGGGGHECTCGTKKNSAVALSSARQFVYALGTLGYDFGTEARRDSIQQFMRQGTPTDPAALIQYLDDNPEEAERIIWTLNLGTTPIYAIQPVGAFSNESYAKIVDGFTRQVNGDIPLFAIPGVMAGSVQLLSGLVVPILIPNTRGMTGWSPKLVSDDIEKTLKERKYKKADIDLIVGALPDALRNFLNRVERQKRNLGIAGADRALNYSATAAFRVLDVLLQTIPRKLELDDIVVTWSATCRPGSECFDVDIRFFSPDDVRQPIWVFRFTIDVNDQVPVYVDAIRSWTERPRD
jgi:cyanobactin maturation PatA/PatG family protease